MEMKTVLLIEDDEHKSRQLQAFLADRFPDLVVIARRSFQSGLEAVLEGRADLILLDMTLTTFDVDDDEEGGRPRPYGGREILEHMQEEAIYTPTIVVTQYNSFGDSDNKTTLDQLKRELEQQFPEMYSGTVYYHIALESWKSDLLDQMGRLGIR
jgi:CheY-like chemotaxis protein